MTPSFLSRLLQAAIAGLIALFAACAAPPPPPPLPPSVNNDEVPFDQAVATAATSLIAQSQQLPGFKAKPAARSLIVDPMLDSGSGQQTALTRRLEDAMTARLRAEQPPFELLPFSATSLAQAQFLMTGTLTRLPAAPGAKAGERSPFQINVSLVDLKAGVVIAQASSRARDDNLDTTPLPYYRESPVLLKDRALAGYVSTSQTVAGQPADAGYLSSLTAAIAINEATLAFNAGQYERALEMYKAALSAAGGEQLRTLNGIYLSSWKLGRSAEAEQAFGKVVALGISNNSLGVKFLFNPNTTEFWSDTRVSGPYALWVRQIARQVAAAKVCMNVVGHTSRTGSEAYNDRLSEQRAVAIRQKLGAESPELLPRTKAKGVGFHENIIGTGTDDASDALDRRVEFAIQPC